VFQKRTYAVIGLGTFGATLARELQRLGNEVLGIDIEPARVRDVADELSHAIIADARDEEALAEAGLADYDAAVVTIGENLESSILCTMALKTMGVKTVWAKAANRIHHRILARLGADRVLLPEQEMAVHMAQMLDTPLVVDFLRVRDGLLVVAVDVAEQLAAQEPELDLAGLAEGHEVRVLGIVRGGEFVPPDTAGLQLEEGDRLLLLGREENLRRLGSKV
jgi:trk system potassium uptake protein TrkA